MSFSQQKTLGNPRVRNSQQTEEDSEDRYDEKKNPPNPEYKEELLIEHVVPEDAEDVLVIDASVRSANLEGARDLGGEHLAHRVVEGHVMSPGLLVGVEVSQDLQAVQPELVVEEPMSYLDREKHDEDVNNLAKGEVDVVTGEPISVLHKLSGDLTRGYNCELLHIFLLVLVFVFLSSSLIVVVAASRSFFLSTIISSAALFEEIPSLLSSSHDVAHQILLEVLFPKGMWKLRQQKEKREKVWEPEVVSRDGSIFGTGNVTLIHETSSDAFSVDGA